MPLLHYLLWDLHVAFLVLCWNLNSFSCHELLGVLIAQDLAWDLACTKYYLHYNNFHLVLYAY